jgi:hypothetical protein
MAVLDDHTLADLIKGQRASQLRNLLEKTR